MSSGPAPLAGIRALEFCHTIMGPACGLVLADLGADVIKVEPAPEGDKTRRLAGFAAGFFPYFNRNKRSLAVDVKTEAGRALVLRLAGSADVLVENFAPGTMDRLGLGWDALHAANPRLVYCSLKGFLSGPYEHRPALDEVVQYMTGLAYMTGPPGQPLRAGASIVDILGGVFGAVAILAALRERDATGEGRLVKSALFESAAFLMAQHMAGHAATGREPPPMPARLGAWAIYDPFPTRDGATLFVGITSDNHWRRFCAAFGRPDLLADPALRTNEARVAARASLKPIVAAILAERTLADLVAILEREAIPFSPVARPRDLFDDPQLNAFGRLVETAMPNGVVAKLPRLPVEIGEHALGLTRQPPRVGEHTAEILAEIGVAPGEVGRLAAAGIVATGAGERDGA